MIPVIMRNASEIRKMPPASKGEIRDISSR